MQAMRGTLGGNPLRIVGIVALVALAAWGIPKLLDSAGASGDDWTFEETLPEVKDDFGDDAKVSTISVLGGSITYSVIDSAGTLHTRRYFVETEQTRGPQGEPATGRTRRTENSERPATPKENAEAVVTLGDLDEGMVEEMWDEAGFPSEGSSAALVGEVWSLSSGADPFAKFTADADGSNVVQTKSKEDTFRQQPVPASPAEVQSPRDNPVVQDAQRLNECIQQAGGDIARIQACTAQ